LEIVPVPGDPEERGLGVQVFVRLDIVIDAVLRDEMWYQIFPTRQPATVGQRAPDIVLKCGYFGCRFGHVDTLRGFDLNGFVTSVVIERLEEIRRCKDGIRALKLEKKWLACHGVKGNC
jgi:hypothetical protein